MKNAKKLLCLLMAIAMVLSLAACGTKEQPTQTQSAQTEAPVQTTAATEQMPEETEAAAKRTEYPLTITTYNYEKEEVQFTFEKAPERVWAQNQNNIEVLLALGLGDKIVGACGLDGDVREELQDAFATINYYDSMPPKEEIIALEPDFITGWKSTFSDKRLGDVDFWHERGIGTYMSLNSGTPGFDLGRLDRECQDILTLGMIFDVQDKAEAIVAEIQNELKNVEDYLDGKERLRVAVLEDEGGTYRVYGADTLGGCVALAGGADLCVGKPGETGNISAEDLIAVNPDVIFMVWYDGYSVNDTDYAGDHVVELITENPAFASLDAVQNGRVYPLNLKYSYCTGMNTLDGVRLIAKTLYPELYQ